MKAQFVGDGGFGSSNSPPLSLTIDGGTTTSLARIPTRAKVGQTVTFTATVTSITGGAAPTGTVKFSDGAAVLGTQPLVNGAAVLATSSLALGGHAVVATYNGNANLEPSASPSASTSVLQGDTDIALSATSLAPLPGKPVTFTAVVTPRSPAAGLLGGSVTFKNGATVLASVNLAAGGTAKCTATLGIGAHSITATYSGDGSFKSSHSPKLTVAVSP